MINQYVLEVSQIINNQDKLLYETKMAVLLPVVKVLQCLWVNPAIFTKFTYSAEKYPF